MELIAIGDRDILRDTTSAWRVFFSRAREGWIRALLWGVLSLLVALSVALLVLGPERSGIPIATRDNVAVVLSALGVLWTAYTGWTLFKFAPSRNDRVVINLRRMVRHDIDPLEERVRGWTDDQLRENTAALKKRIADGESLDSVRPEAYACVREASRRGRNHRQFECQLIGGRVIEGSNVAEMKTGEGKTIVCYMANYMKVIQGLKVHMVTVNDYLVKRDAEFCRPIFELLGVSVGYISAEMGTYGAEAEPRKRAYACDITYGTNSEFGFDYLRDNMKHYVPDQAQGRLDFVVVDEVDSILIDEARTPLIISGPAHDDVGKYRQADHVAQMLIRKQQQANRDTAAHLPSMERDPPPEAKGNAKFADGIKKFKADPYWLSSDEAEAIGHLQYFVVEMDRKSAHMTEHGAKAAQAELGIGTFYDGKNMNWPHYIDNALRAHIVYHKDKEYVVQEDTIIIVDEFTGRLMHGRQWSDGLHQAVEAKERVTIKQETQTLATITLQNFFKLYKQLAGMTGTAMTEADEFMKIYKLEVIAIPTNRPVRRIDYNDKIYKTVENKWEAIVEEIRSYSQNGYPADPWSLYDILRTWAKQLKRQPKSEDPDPAASAAALQSIKDALEKFDDGKGDEKPLEETYVKLMEGRTAGRPVLVGTVSVENSEKLSQLLTRRYGIEHEVLNAKNHAREAEIVAKAGQQHESIRGKHKSLVGNVTIATNMAGRGTDIVLGPGVAQIGGLHVLGTERHESRRIDNQLRGRCGRQGDLGSSRFFLSLEDDLLKLFMGEWALKMLNLLGFEEGMAIEDKRLTKGIERAQKKVEERNFGIRKNLLEYDEVMDYQRRTFYSMRQQVVEGRGVSDIIWRMIDETVGDAVDRFLDPKFPALNVAEWVSQNLEVAIPAGKLDTGNFEQLQSQVREAASEEARSLVQRTFGEYIDPDVDPEEWDVRGFSNWVARFGLGFTQNQIKRTDPTELQEKIVEAAVAKVEERDLVPLQQFVDPTYARSRLVQWAKDKFDVDIPLNDIVSVPRDEAVRIIGEKMREAYRRREIEYPPHVAVEIALQRGGTNVNAVLDHIAGWANYKYRVGWSYEHLAGKNPDEIFGELRHIQQEWLEKGKLEQEVDAAIEAARTHGGNGGNGGAPTIGDWAKARFGPLAAQNGLANLNGQMPPDVRDRLIDCGRELLCYELRQLERYILLNIYDTVWKDHMYAMDLLRSGIGLRGYAERDPKIEYKREGTRMFGEMLANVRERVTDLIFKAQVAVGGQERAMAYAAMQAGKADATNAGFAGADQQAAMAKQGEAAKPDPIRRTMPRVGRNDACPCGSGKKYKHCHGKGG